MQFEPLLPFNQWKAIGVRMGRYSNGSSWWLGDWLAFGRMKYGRRYKEAVAATGLDYQTLRNYVVVARRFELSRRRDNLPFQHHAEVCALSDGDQDRWLDLAVAGNWSRNDLRRHLRASSPPEVMNMVRLSVNVSRQSRWQRAAAVRQLDLDAWIMRTLDHAAELALDEGRDAGEAVSQSARPSAPFGTDFVPPTPLNLHKDGG
ncbi:MAG: hypothetical protein V7607_2153 [Solirubrobacteraceae bacterium]